MRRQPLRFAAIATATSLASANCPLDESTTRILPYYFDSYGNCLTFDRSQSMMDCLSNSGLTDVFAAFSDTGDSCAACFVDFYDTFNSTITSDCVDLSKNIQFRKTTPACGTPLVQARTAFAACYGDDTDIVTGAPAKWLADVDAMIEFDDKFKPYASLVVAGAWMARNATLSTREILDVWMNAKVRNESSVEEFFSNLDGFGNSLSECYFSVSDSLSELANQGVLAQSCFGINAYSHQEGSYCGIENSIFFPAGPWTLSPFCHNCYEEYNLQTVLSTFYACAGYSLNYSYYETMTGTSDIEVLTAPNYVNVTSGSAIGLGAHAVTAAAILSVILSSII